MKIGVSFLKSNLSLEKTIKEIENTDCEYLHVDIMDGKYVSNKGFEIRQLKRVLKNVNKPLDIHLMVENPQKYISFLASLNPTYITFHSDIDNVEDNINLIHSYNIKAGIAINPDINVDKVKKYLKLVDYVLIMGVFPGAGGQRMIIETTFKIKELINYRIHDNLDFIISFDGGVSNENINYLKGLDLAIAGSYVCMNDDYQRAIDTLRI